MTAIGPAEATEPAGGSETHGGAHTGEQHLGQVDRAARGTALNLVGSVIAAVVSFVTVGVITNVYGKAGAGVFFAATAAFTLAANAARLGAESGLTYFVSRLRADGGHRRIPVAIRTALGATALVAGSLGLAGLVGATGLSDLITTDTRYGETATTMIRILAVAVPTFALSQAMFGATRGFGTMRPAVVAGQIVRPLTQLGFVSVAIVISDEVWPLALAWAASSVLTMATVGSWLRRRLQVVAERHGTDGAGRPADDADGTGDSATFSRSVYWRYSAPRALADLLSAMLERLDVLLVAILVSEAGAGMYGASNRLILAGQMMMVATAQSMAPLLAADFLKGRLDDAQRVLRTISGWNVTLLWPVFLGLAFGAETALSVFGPEFTEAAPLVVVLSVAFLIITGLGIGDTMLMMTGDSVASLINHGIALAVMLATAIVLLPMYGIIGAAWAWAASRVLLRILAVLRVYRTKGIHAIGSPVLIAAAVALVAYVPAGLVVHGAADGWVAVAAHVGVGGVLHLLMLTRVHRILAIDQLLSVVVKRRA
ncbi:MAG: polysaccharide biosynthesis C-terminal domain-containing protein [Actinomycetota bacterium]